jgi:hypothetical protein
MCVLVIRVALSRSEAKRVSYWRVKWAGSAEAIGLVMERVGMLEHGAGVALGPD